MSNKNMWPHSIRRIADSRGEKIKRVGVDGISFFSVRPLKFETGKEAEFFPARKRRNFYRAGQGGSSGSLLRTFVTGGLTVLVSVAVIFTVVKAGSLTPSSAPGAEGYTLSDIYTKLTANTDAASGAFSMSPSGNPSGTLYSLEQIYAAIPTIVASTVKLGTSYLGVDGALVPDGGNAGVGNVLAGKTFFGDSQTDWNLKTGTMPNIGSQIITPSASNQAISLGYHDGTGFVAGDTDLIASNIKNGVDLFGVSGSLVTNPLFGDNTAANVLTIAANPGTYDASSLTPANVRNGIAFGVGQTGTFSGNLAYGDDSAANVLTIASTPGTYNVSNLSNSVIKSGTTWGVGLGSTGSLTPDGGTAGVGDLFNGKTANLTNDWNLDTGTLDLACNTAVFDGVGNLVADTYDGAGIGNNRWCMTDSGDAVGADILIGKKAWIGGIEVTGTMASRTLSAASQTVDAGYYGATTLSAVDSDLAAGNIKKGAAIFGFSGAYSGYPGTGWSGTSITQADCDAQNPTWYWFADGNGDGDTTDSEDGVCVRASAVTSLSWNGAEQIAPTAITAQAATGGSANTIVKASAGWTANAYANAVVKVTSGTASGCWGVVKSNTTDTITVYGSWLSSAYASNCGTPNATSVFAVEDDGFALYDNSWIGDWTCSGSFPSGAPSWGSFPTSAQVGASAIALATTDCYDGTRDLLPTEASRAVKTGTATAASSTTITDSSLSLNTNAWVGQKVLIIGGTGSGGYGRIESNTGTAITVDSWTGGTPDVGSTFAIIYLIPHATYNPGTNIDGDTDDQLNGNNGPLTQEVLNNWKGTKLPTASDFFGFCGYKDGGSNYESTTGTSTADETYGNYGGQVGRTDEFLDLANSGSWEWLSEQHSHYYARLAGYGACSNFSYSNVNFGYRFRAVFRP